MRITGVVHRVRGATHRALQYVGVALNARGLTARDRPVTGPLYAQISVSDPCNQRCLMCEYHPPTEDSRALAQFGGKRPGVMDLATFKRVADELYGLGTRQIDLVGRGEPLLNRHAIEMVAHAKQRGMTVSMTSNGSPLTPERARALVQIGLDRYRVSLDAARPETYAKIHVSETAAVFAKIKSQVRELAEIRSRSGGAMPHLTLSFTIGALNYGEIVEMVETIHEVGADAGHFQHCLPVTAEAESTALSDRQYEQLQSTLIPAGLVRASALGIETNLRGFLAAPPAYRLDREETGPGVVPCYIGSYFTVILGNGNVLPCCQSELPIASIEDGGFAQVWKGDAYAEFRRAARNLPMPSPALATCQCDRCYFRPHNIAMHNALHPLSRIKRPEQPMPVKQLVRMSRLDQ